MLPVRKFFCHNRKHIPRRGLYPSINHKNTRYDGREEFDPGAACRIRERVEGLKAERKLRKVYPMAVFGETDCGEKEVYVAYMAEPTFPQFSKFMAASKKDEVTAMRTLARDCFVDGDKELVDNESLFLFGLMGQLSELITTRQSVLVNL